MTEPKISVVMSVFNGDCFLRESVESILSQSLRDFEFIIIDDGSTDGSGAILDSYQEKDSRVRVLNQENRGLTAALNRGCQLARGDYIARMDADDIAGPDRLVLQLEFMEAHPEVAVLGGAVEFVDPTGKALNKVRYPVGNREIQTALLDSSVLWHPTVLFRKAAFLQVGGYRNVIAEDYDLWLRIAEQFQLANLENVVLKYRVHPGQISVRKCRQLAVGAAAVQVAAWARRAGKPDPLNGADSITPAILQELGVSDEALQTAVGRGYLSCIRNMVAAGEYSLAQEALEAMYSAQFGLAAKWVLAELHVMAARIFWKQRQYAKCLQSAAQAFVMRPIMLGRPLKPLLCRLGLVTNAYVKVF
jgi:cellulose synthase/poly-beta-1,6-N-acetylglucosamine synthase-like glycosyltransferase